MRYFWSDRTSEANALGLIRSGAIAHGGYQIGPGGYAANENGQIDAAELPSRTVRLFSSSQGVWALANVSGTPPAGSGMRLYLSPDGIDGYTLKYEDATAGRMHGTLPLLVDCGSDRLILTEYCTDLDPATLNVNKIWGSDDGGENWSVLFTTAAGSIRHFHGGRYDPLYGRLYLFTGDGTLSSSILFTDDVDDLLANPSTWQDRWGLSDSTRSTISEDWIVGYNDVKYRTITSLLYGDHIYWGTDSSNSTTGVPMSRVRRNGGSTQVVHVPYHSNAVATGLAMGEIWQCGFGTNRTPLFISSGRAPGPNYYGDGNAYLYAIWPGSKSQVLRAIPGTNVVTSDIHTIGKYTIISSYLNTFNSQAGIIQWGRITDSIELLLPGASRLTHTPRNLLLESGDRFLLETGGRLII